MDSVLTKHDDEYDTQYPGPIVTDVQFREFPDDLTSCSITLDEESSPYDTLADVPPFVFDSSVRYTGNMNASNGCTGRLERPTTDSMNVKSGSGEALVDLLTRRFPKTPTTE